MYLIIFLYQIKGGNQYQACKTYAGNVYLVCLCLFYGFLLGQISRVQRVSAAGDQKCQSHGQSLIG